MGASFVVIEAFRDGLELGPTLRRISTPRAPEWLEQRRQGR
jgi:hypothetical protein